MAPTTDILGNERIRGAASEYADPGAFTTDLITATRTIGKDGWQDFTTFTDAEADANTIANELLGGSRLNLAERNGKIVYEAYAGTYSESVNIQNSLTTDATHNVTYKAATGSEHGGVIDGGVLLTQTNDPNNYTLRIFDDYITLQGLGIEQVGTTRTILPGS